MRMPSARNGQSRRSQRSATRARRAVLAHRAIANLLAAVLMVATTRGLAAQSRSSTGSPSTRSVATDARWYAWLGCWEPDTARTSSTKCIVPASGTNTVDELTLANGNIVARDRLDISGRPHPIRQQGCDGSESVTWSATGRRIFLRSDYVCATGIKGTSTRMFAILPNGDWLEVENVRAGSGSIVHAARRHDAGAPANAPREVAAVVGAQQLAVSAARANAAAPITVDDVLEALHTTDPASVRTWLVATNEPFSLDAEQVLELAHQDVPTSVLQAMLSSVPQRQLGSAPMGSTASDEYLSTPSYAPGSANQSMPPYGESMPYGTSCTPAGCYGPGGG